MTRYLAAYLATALAFVALDACWITLVGGKLYRPVIGEIMAERIRMAPAIAFYVLYIGGIVALAVRPALTSGLWIEAAVLGAILGLVAYGTYALTDQAILKLWSTKLTVADMAWGAAASGAAATAGFLAARFFSR